MNIASFILPKVEVAYLHDNMTVRQGLERLKRSGYTAVPVLDSEDRYVGTISEGDFLWHIMQNYQNLDEVTMKKVEELSIRDIIQSGKIAAVFIDTNMEQLLGQAQMQNFVPVVDDRNIFVGIITRGEIIKYFVKKQLEMVNRF